MANKELTTYIEKAHAKGKTNDEIKKELIGAGWDKKEVELAFNQNDELTVPKPPSQIPLPPKPQSTSAWDAFEHVLMFISLYTMATSIALILHYFVDKWVPGVPVNNYGYSYTNNDWQLTLFRGYLAALIVSLPLFSFFFLRITKRALINPLVRMEKTRRQLIYITLVVTFIIMLWNVITAVYNFLSGNVTFNFILHLLVTIGVSGIIFYYYLSEVKEDRKLAHA